MEDFAKKVSISEPETSTKPLNMEIQVEEKQEKDSTINQTIVGLLRRFLGVQQRRALAYARLKRGFEDYVVSGGELAYQKLCSEITVEFNDCSKQVLEMESVFASPDCCREDLAGLLRSVQVQEKEKLHLTATIQVLKKAGRPSERLVSHENCRFTHSTGHECVHIQQITEESGTEEAEADSEYDNALKEAVTRLQDAVIAINEHLEEVSKHNAEDRIKVFTDEFGGSAHFFISGPHCVDARPKIHSSVANAIIGSTIKVHCFSRDDDLGYHQLAYLQQFSWSFSNSVLGITQFFCTITTQYGSGSYKVYADSLMLDRCGTNCNWKVETHGPCLQQTRGGPWCLPWQKKEWLIT
ncbi:DNA repair REX1-B protein [Perilla frutescens var. frutescens]|nr:DNA repair REX1-B protein [Perilla frutescens var. frutescens]